jgi:apolipoprotein N-acyltransferase
VRLRVLAHPVTASVAAGALYALAFPPYRLSPLAWVALVPLVVAVRRTRTWRAALLCGASAAVVMCAIGYAWIADMAVRFWRVPWPVAALLLLLYSSFGEINFTLFAVIVHRLRGRLERLPAAATAALFTLLEVLVPKIFPDTLGSTQVDVPALPSSAAYVGTYGLTFLLAWFAACVAWLAWSPSGSRRRRGVELVFCLGCAAALFAAGAARRRSVDALPVARQLRVALVQSDIGDAGMILEALGTSALMADTVVATYTRLTRQALRQGPVDVVIWPETSMPVSPRDPVFERVRTLVRDLDVPLVFGGYDFKVLNTGAWRVYNTLFWMDRDGRIRERYYKHVLLPLGEHVPFAERWPVLLDIIPNAGQFSAGPGARALEVDGLRFTPLICYEVLFPRYVRRGIRLGGDFLLNLTNDYWFGLYAEPEQHLALARMRAYETGRPIARATNTGYTALIDANARVLASTALWQTEVLHATLPVPAAAATLYLRAGEWTVAALVAGLWMLVALLWKLFP